MVDQTLTDEEKGALLDGISSGEVEAQVDGVQRYADVQEFVIGPRSRIATNTFPRLNLLNRQLAIRLSRQAEQMLNIETEITSCSTENETYSDFLERHQSLSLVVEFSPAPLPGTALLYLSSGLMGHLVESFFGGYGNEPVRQNDEIFSPGECLVAGLFADEMLASITDAWESLVNLQVERTGIRQCTDIIDGLETTDPVLSTEFTMNFGEQQEKFHVVWPASVVASLMPVFEGQKRDRDPVEDARWAQALRARIPDSPITISSNVGRASLTLAAVAELGPGDIISIDSPRAATLFANHKAMLEGRFGVHDGHYAIEATNWLVPG